MASKFLSHSHCLRVLRHSCIQQQASKAVGGIQIRANHYDVLGVNRDATSDEIRTAFLNKSKEHHPDTGSNKGTHETFVKVNEAYTILSKRTSRRDYDLQLAVVKSSTVDPKSFYTQQGEQQQGQYYHHAKSFYDPQMYSMRDKSQDEHYKNRPFYGVQGVQTISNKNIVIGCVIFTFLGIIFHSLVLKKSVSKYLKTLSDRDEKNHALWTDHVNLAKSLTKEQQMDWLKHQAASKSTSLSK